MERTMAVVAAEHKPLVSPMKDRIPPVQVESEEVARVRRMAMALEVSMDYFAEQRELQIQAAAVAVSVVRGAGCRSMNRDCPVARLL